MIDTNSEEWRHQCEVRWAITKGREWFDAYIAGVKKIRGQEAARRLWNDVRDQAQAGNTGAPGMWIEARQPELIA